MERIGNSARLRTAAQFLDRPKQPVYEEQDNWRRIT
jgi:hypothetical protein